MVVDLTDELSVADTLGRGPALGDTGLSLWRGSQSEVYAQQSLQGALSSLFIQASFECNVEGSVHAENFSSLSISYTVDHPWLCSLEETGTSSAV